MDRNRHGFTLIELLIVVSIIALLVGMVLPTLRRAKQITARTVCASNLHAVGVGFYMYLEQSNEIMPVAAAMPSLHLNDDPRIADVLAPHLTHPKVLRCRADTERNFYESEGSSYQYSTLLGGQKVGEGFLTRHFGESKTPVMYDYEPFHGPAGTSGSANYLFADMHVGDLE